MERAYTKPADTGRIGKSKSEGLEYVQQLRQKQINEAKQRGNLQLPGQIVGLFGVQPLGHKRGEHNPLLVAWTVSPHRRDQRTGVVSPPVPMSEYAKDLYRIAVPWACK